MLNYRTRRLVISLFLIILTLSFITAAEANTEGLLQGLKSNTSLKAAIEQNRAEITKALENKKANLKASHKKLSTDLLQLVNEDFILQGQTKDELKQQMKSLKQLRVPAAANRSNAGAVDNELVYVYIYLNSPAGTHIIDSYVQELTDRDEENQVAVAWVAINSLESLAELKAVRSIQTVIPPVCNTGSVTSEGDSIHRADLVRSLGQDGTGIKVGIISDGVDHWTDAKKSGDLPANLHVLSNSVGGDEGTAMLEIVHDLAPGAELYFHDCGDNYIAFNSAIDDLIAAGCEVLCDDIGWYGEPYFEDGSIAEHIANKLATNNIIYISSAGNDAFSHYQGTYLNDGYNFHDFSNGTSEYKDLYIDIPPGDEVVIILQWSDKFGTSVNDYDLVLYDEATENFIDASDYVQDGNDDPIEVIAYTNETNQTVLGDILVYKERQAAAKSIEVFILRGYNSMHYIDNLTEEDSIFGHPAVPEVIAVGAIDVPNQNEVAFYSSQGPATIVYPNTVKRSKPDICGIAGVSVTGAGGFCADSDNRFFGTSAAAPHLAAITALAWAENPDKTASDIRNALLAGAIDLGDSGFDYIYGYGRADALNSFDITPPTYQDAAIDSTNKIVTLTFSENLIAGTSNLKGAVTLATDGTTFAALGANDTVALSGNTLVVTLNAALTGNNSKISLAAGSLRDEAGNVLGSVVTTESIVASGEPAGGDINKDGSTDIQDVMIAVNIALGRYDCTPEEKDVADAYKDGKVDIQDVMTIVNIALGRI